MRSKIWWVLIIFLAALNVIWFWPGKLYFLNDDLLHIPLTDQGYLFQTNSVRPVHEWLLRGELFLFGKNSFGYHLTALLLHLLVTYQLFDFCWLVQKNWLKIEQKQAMHAALVAVALFLIYPQSSESLGWILGRAPIVSAIFLMLTIRIFFIENYQPVFFIAGAFFFATTLFAYEQSILLPLALGVIAYFDDRREKRRSGLIYSSLLGLVGLGYIITRKLITSEVIGMYEGGNLLRWNGIAMLSNFFRILSRLILNPASKTMFMTTVLMLVVIVSVAFYITKKQGSNHRMKRLFGIILLMLVVPVVSLGVAVNSFESGRYLYLPSIFLIAGLSIGGVAFFYHVQRCKMALFVTLILLSVYWIQAKHTAARYYTEASSYARFVETKIQKHFAVSSDTLYLDTLRVTVYRLPVFRRGFKTGVNWLNGQIDTGKIVVHYYHDEVAPRAVE